MARKLRRVNSIPLRVDLDFKLELERFAEQNDLSIRQATKLMAKRLKNLSKDEIKF